MYLRDDFDEDDPAELKLAKLKYNIFTSHCPYISVLSLGYGFPRVYHIMYAQMWFQWRRTQMDGNLLNQQKDSTL